MRFRVWIRAQKEKWKRDIESLIRQTRVMMEICKHPGAPWYVKTIAGLSVGYIFSPIQLIPTFIPLIGQLDDLLVLYLGMKAVQQLTPRFVLTECEALAEKAPSQAQSVTKDAETLQSTEEPRMAA
jgi:uncharacterized membrane protein YkvA (DUF1232 family)